MTEIIEPARLFDEGTATEAVSEFCRRRRVSTATRVTVVETFAAAVDIITLKGPDERWRRIHGRGARADHPNAIPGPTGRRADRLVYEFLTRKQERWSSGRTEQRPPWFARYTLISAHHWSYFSDALHAAHLAGLGWMLPASREVLLVPAPSVRFAEGSPGVLHDDAGRPALQWRDGTGVFCLHGAEFDEITYRRTVAGTLDLTDIARLPNADQRSIALQYISFARLVSECGARLMNVGARGTSLYRLPLPARIAADRPPGYGGWDYFIHMRDASHPEREFIEWVDPLIGRRGDAELCQARAFGISLEDWLAVDQEG